MRSRAETEAAFRKPLLNELRVAAAAKFHNVRRTYLDRTRVGRFDEVEIEDSAGQPTAIWHGLRSEAAGCGLKQVGRGPGNDFIVAVIEGDLDFAQDDLDDPFDISGIE